MEFILVFPLMLSIISSQQSYAEGPKNQIKECDPGEYLNNRGHAGPKCEKCPKHTYTRIPNSSPRCLRCRSCKHYEIETKPCSFISDTECGCKNGSYYSNTSDDCVTCSCANCNNSVGNPDFILKCQPCQMKECLTVPGCKRLCTTTTAPLPANSSTTASTVTGNTPAPASPTGPLGSNNTSDPEVVELSPKPVNQMSWLLLAVVGILSLLLFGLLVLFTRILLRHIDSILCCGASKDLELSADDPRSNEQRRHRGSSPTTLTFTITEKSPMMPVSQSPPIPEHPAPMSPQPPGSDHTVARQDELSERWPAIVLYAIIKEVPLRRWKEFLRLLSVADQQLERVELEAGLGLGSMERQYQMLRLWSQRSTANISDVFSALHYMELSGCAQLLQENLDKLPWRPDPNSGLRACRNHSGHGLNGARHT